jgi:hypothetical protein
VILPCTSLSKAEDCENAPKTSCTSCKESEKFSKGSIMATKRKHQEESPREAVHASRQFQVYGNNPKPAKKPRRFEPPGHRKQAHASSMNAIKKRIRDVTRKLERVEDLPADVRAEDERALAVYQQELVSAHAEKTRQKMIKKYHMVRFFGT